MIEGLQPGFILLNAVDELPDEPPPDDGWDAQTHGEPWQLADSQLLDLLRDAQRTAAAAHAQWLALLAEAERRNATLQATALPTASWLAIHNSHTARTARAEVLLATRVAECAPVAQAYAQGALSTEQAATIVHGLDRLPDSLPAADRDEVARQLVEWAGDFNPAGLRRLVDHAVSVVAPEVADAADAAALERLERQQQRDRHLSWRRDHDGCILLAGKLPPVAGEAVIGHLTALAARQRAVDALSGLETSPGQAAADALVQLVTHHARCQGAPSRGGEPVRLVVTVGLEQLVSGLGAATLVGSGETISAGQARRLACDAGILPMVLGGAGQPLDVGREQRLFTNAQRAALAQRDGGCAFPACDRPPSDCEAHHVRPWWDGGESNLANGILLCPHHHHLIEPNPATPPDRNWTITFDARGKPLFTAPLTPGATTRIVRQHHRYRT